MWKLNWNLIVVAAEERVEGARGSTKIEPTSGECQGPTPNSAAYLVDP